MCKPQLTRRNFVSDVAKKSAGILLGSQWLSSFPYGKEDFSAKEPLFDRKLWEQYRSQVTHPSLVVKRKNLDIAKKNAATNQWAKNYIANIEKSARHHLVYTQDEHLEKLIQVTTPGDPLWTPCPACRDQKKPMHPHGQWAWDIQNYEALTCTICNTVFPNAQYPESIVINTKWGKPQKLTFYGGETFPLFNFPESRPTFAGNIRSRCVEWCSDYARLLGETYSLTGKPEFAIACKKILLRLADCYPNWLVHVGYGEYADMDPREAALHINDLPQPELTPTPNKPDHKLWTGYWSAGRSRGVGLESDFVMKVAEAYDLTCTASTASGQPVYLNSERTKIEKDLLLESTILLVCDKKINNKSVRNRTAVGLVGICVGHPELFRFGLEGFNKTLDEWFLSDATTSESPVYGFMTLKGIWALAEAAKGYSDPEGYLDNDGKRIDSLNLYQDTKYKKMFEALYNGLQGDLTCTPYADSFEGFTVNPAYVDLLVSNYPENKSYHSFLEELCGKGLKLPSGPAPSAFFQESSDPLSINVNSLVQDQAIPTDSITSFSLYFRDPGSALSAAAPLTLPDWNPESLRIGHLRTGSDGRESLLMLSASHWGNHHHKDSLNLYYWKNGCEILSDLGYLWDHPMKEKTVRTLAHNTVLINEKDQLTTKRKGSIDFFETSARIKVMRASSNAYEEASVYSRTTSLIDHGNGNNYAVDFFEVEGGEIQDFVFHLNGLNYKVQGIDFGRNSRESLYDFDETRIGTGENSWSITWDLGKGMTARAWIVSTGEEVFMGRGWGQRDWKNTDVGKQVRYVVRRGKGEKRKKFISLFEGFSGEEPFIKKVRLSDHSGIVEVTTANGTDLLMSSLETQNLDVRHPAIHLKETGKFVAYIQNGTGIPAKLVVS